MPEQKKIAGIKTERRAYLFDLVDKAGNSPQIGNVGLVAVMRALLVVVIDSNDGSQQIGVARLEVLVRRPRPAMQQQQLHARIVAYALGPHLEIPVRLRD